MTEPNLVTTHGASQPQQAEVLLAEVAEALRSRGERMTEPRRAVLAALARRPGHATAEEVVEEVARDAPGVHRASVYRTLDLLAGMGVVQHVHLGKGSTTYHLTPSTGPHLHAQCTECGRLVDLPAELMDPLVQLLRRDHGFWLDPGHVALAGVCAQCRMPGESGGAGQSGS